MVDKETAKQVYDADSLHKLDPIDHIRKRISMYLGDNTGEGGLSTALREIIDNSQDEFLNGHGKKIVLTFFADGSAEVQDSGRGIPTGINKATGENGIVLSLAHVGAGGKFGVAGNGYSSGAGGLNGVGTTASNAVSKRFDVTVYQNGKEHKISFQKGKPGFFAKDNDPDSKFTPDRNLKSKPDPRSAKEKKERPTGTTIKMWPDEDIFIPGAKFDVDTIKFRLKSTAFLLPGLCIQVNDYRDEKNPVEETYEFDGGIAEMLETIAPDKALIKPVHFMAEGTFTEIAPIADEHGKITTGEVTRHVDIDVAFQYGEGYDTVMKSFVNIINTKHGGKHEDGFYRGLNKVIIDSIKGTRGLLKAKEEAPTGEDVKEGLTAIISVKFPEPQFVGQEKSTLGTSAITSVVYQAVTTELKAWLANKKNAAAAKVIYQKVVNASRIRVAQKVQKETARRKTSLESASMPSKLVDCSETNTQFSELHICEGDSALGTMKSARDSRYQALLPIRGKILNVQKATLKQMLDNAECAALIQVIGAGSGRNFDISQMRYHNVGIAVDADVDGAHIRTLLITFFWKYMRPLVEAGRLYATMPPLYVLKTKGKNSEIFYLSSDEERDKLIAKLEKAGKKYEPLQRLKGLGEMDASEFWDTTLNPETRSLRRITIADAEQAEKMLELAMGNNVESRRNWIVDSREKISDDELDV